MINKIDIKYRVTLIIPAYQEENGIEATLSEIIKLKDKGFIDEIIIVDDGSKDKTKEIVASYDDIKLIRHKKNKGYGASLKTGINNSSNDIICITDCDGTYPSDQIPILIEKLIKNDLDMIVGARTGKIVKIPLIRKPAKWFIGKLANWVSGNNIPDINSGLRLFKKKSFIPFHGIVPNGFSFTTTITLGMISGGYKIDFHPIEYGKRIGKSKIRPFRDTLNFIMLILRIGLYFSPLKIFLPISFALLSSSIIWGLYSKYIIGQLADLSVLIIAMTGFHILAISLIAELINNRLPNKYNK
tara:strand:- start:3311 stop:4210 length:900 start_codon:yes stop_codon:yes gene_type:complete